MNRAIGGARIEIRPGRALAIAHRAKGAAVTLIFVHGGGGNKEQWRFQWRFFEQRPVDLLAWDAIGHGASARPRDAGSYSGTEMLADFDAVFARHRTTRNIVVAHSFGARLALAWALACAERGEAGPDALLLLGAAPLGKLGDRLLPGRLGLLPLPLLELLRPLLARRFAKLAWHPGADPALVRAEQRETRRNTLFMMQAIMSGAPLVPHARLDTLSARTIILAGADDHLVPDPVSVALAAAMPRAQFRRIEACGHQIMMERPAETNAAISDLLSEVTDAA